MKETYIEEVRNKMTEGTDLVIYGAGRKALGLLKLLHEGNIYPKAFLVTERGENKDQEHGLKIFDVHDNPFKPKQTLILIGIRKRWNEDVIETLKSQGYENYLIAPEGIEYFAEGDLDRSHRTVLQITTQIGCKIDCKYCPQKLFIDHYTSDKTRCHSMTLEAFKRYVDQTEKEVIIDFAGFSEPFFNANCIEMIKYAYETGHDVELFTTLMGLDKEGFEKIKNIPFREVVLHIPDEDENSKIAITEEYVELLRKVLDTKKVDGRPFADWASCHGKIESRIQEIIDGRLRVITQLHDRAGNLDDSDLEQQHGIKGAITCSNTDARYHNHNVLLPDGTILLCDSDWGMQHILGNLNDNTYQEILNGENSKKIYELRNLEDSCIICRECCYAIKKRGISE